MTNGWIVVDVGCIECGEDSDIVGIFDSQPEADSIAKRLNEVLGFTGGQHSYEVFPVPSLNEVPEYYARALASHGGQQ